MADNLLTNTAHPPGRTCLAFSRDGSLAYTGGEDSLVRIWKLTGDEQEPDAAVDAQERITTIAADNDGWLSGSDDAHVRRYLKSSTDLDSLVTQTSGLPVRCIALDPKGKRVAVTSDEPVVKVINLDDTTDIKILTGHSRGVRRATWHPSGSILTTCGADGKIIAWDLSQDEPRQEKVIEGLLPVIKDYTSDEYAYDCSAVWHTSGQYFLVGTPAHEIVTVSRSTWTKVFTYSDVEHTGAITSLALSVNGVYLASACKSGIYVWSTATRRIIARLPSPSTATVYQLAFSPLTNLLAWTDTDGVLTRWRDVIPASAPSPIKPAPSAAAIAAPVRRQATPTLFGDDTGAGDTVGVDLDAVDVAGDVGDADADIEDNWLIDDIGGGLEDKPDYGKKGLREVVNITKAQPPFQPGATPFVHKRRYLAMNNIGVIEVVDQDSHHIVNVEFYDQSTRRNYHFDDHHKFNLAAIGERGIAYACPSTTTHPAQITYKPYSTWANHGEWTYTLPPTEHAVALAAGGPTPHKSLRARSDAEVEGNGYVAVATNTGVVRFFSGGGMQRGPVWAVDGEVVAMVGGRDYVFVVHREGGTSIDGNQNLKYTLRTADTFRVMHTGRLPVNKGETLKWIGITDEGAPVIYDSAERLMILEHYRFTAQGAWAVLLNATMLARREGKDESYWPVGVSKSTFMCIILKGREEYPGFPRPFAQDIDIQMPYLEMDGQEAPKEERVSREDILLDHLRDNLDDGDLTTSEISREELELDKELIQLILFSCKNDRHQRALDAAKLLHHTASFDKAMQVADFYKLSGLRDKFEFLKAERVDADRLRDERDQRRGWRKSAGPIPPSRDEDYAHYRPGQSYRPLQDTRPAPAIARARLTVATPLNEPSPFSRKPLLNGQVNGHSRETAMQVEDEDEGEESQSSAEGKRKRVEFEEIDPNESISNAKRRQVDTGSNGSSQVQIVAKPNPFAKKSAADKDSGDSNNPFLRKLASHKSIQRGESFFNKVDAAETEREQDAKNKAKRGSKGKPAGQNSKQTTLFELAPKKKAKQTNGSTNSTSQNESQTSLPARAEPADTTMAEAESQESVLETQETTQIETQLETQQENVNGNVLLVDDEEPIEWPDSPPPEVEVEA